MSSVVNLFKLAHVLDVAAENIYEEIRTKAINEVEEKASVLKNENEWVRRVKVREATHFAKFDGVVKN